MSDADLDVGKPSYDRQYATSSTAPVKQDNQPSQTINWSEQAAPQLSAMNPYTDLGYNSFLRGMGLQQSQIQAQMSRQKAGLESGLEAQRPVWADALSRGLKNIGGAAEANGIYRSGQRLQDQNNFQVDQSRAQNAYESGVRGQIGDMQATAQMQLQDLARQKAEQELAARQRLASESLTNQTNPLLLQFIQSQLQGS